MATIFIFLLFAALCVICFVRPPAVLGLALVVYPFEQWAFTVSGFFRAHPAMINYAFGMLALLGVAAVFFRGENPLVPLTASLAFWALLLIYAAASFTWSISPNNTIFLLKFNLPYILTFVVLVPLTIRSADDLAAGLKFGLAAGAVTMLLLLAGTHVHDWGRTIAISGTILDRTGARTSRLTPLVIADMAGAMIVTVGLMNFSRQGQAVTILRWGLVTAAMMLLIRSGTRGQLIASLLVVIMLVGISRSYARHTQFAAVGVMAVMLIALTVWLFNRYNTTIVERWTWQGMEQDFAGTRLDMCLVMLRRWIRSLPLVWIIGLGSSAAYDSSLLGQYPHVVVVEVLTELGFLGMAIFAAFLIATTRAFYSAWSMVREDRVRRGLVCATAGLFLYDFILTFKQGSMLTHTATFMFAMLGARLYVFILQEQSVRRRMRIRALLVLQDWLHRRRRTLWQAT